MLDTFTMCGLFCAYTYRLVNQVKSNLTETQQKAVKQAQEVWKAIPFSTGKDVKVLNEILSKACIAFIENGKEKTKELLSFNCDNMKSDKE